MNREYAIVFCREGAPESVRGFWADSPDQAREDFLEVLPSWAAGPITILKIHRLTDLNGLVNFDTQEAAEYLRSSTRQIGVWMEEGLLPRRICFSRAELEKVRLAAPRYRRLAKTAERDAA